MRGNLFHYAVIAFLMLMIGGCSLQNSMLYFPSPDRPSEGFLKSFHLRSWEASAGDFRGYISDAPAPKQKGTVIVFHGNAGNAADRVYYLDALVPLGYRVILAEYPGYGGRKGDLGEASFVSDARASIRLASEQFGKPVILLGESLGCGIAAAAAKDADISGIILITPWDTLLSIAKEKFPWLPVKWFLKDTYDSIGNLKTFLGRIAIAGAERDEVIPVHHAMTLYGALTGDKKMWMIKAAGHNDWVDVVTPSWWKEITDFAAGGGREPVR